MLKTFENNFPTNHYKFKLSTKFIHSKKKNKNYGPPNGSCTPARHYGLCLVATLVEHLTHSLGYAIAALCVDSREYIYMFIGEILLVFTIIVIIGHFKLLLDDSRRRSRSNPLRRGPAAVRVGSQHALRRGVGVRGCSCTPAFGARAYGSFRIPIEFC